MENLFLKLDIEFALLQEVDDGGTHEADETLSVFILGIFEGPFTLGDKKAHDLHQVFGLVSIHMAGVCPIFRDVL